MTMTEDELWMQLHNAMDGNLSMSKRRKLIADYKAAVTEGNADTLADRGYTAAAHVLRGGV
jgi:hypothetical protein